MKVPSFAPQTLAHKIIGVIVFTTLAATFSLIPAIFFTVRQGMQGQRQRQLEGVRHLVVQLIEENRRAVRNYAVLFATDRQVKDNLYYFAELAGEREHPSSAVRHLVTAFGLSHIELGDRFGRVVIDAASPERQDENLADNPLVRQALAGDTALGIETSEGGFLLKAVAPIYHDEGQLIGTIATGMELDNAFTAMIKGLSGADIAITDRDGLVTATSLPELAPGTRLAPRDEIVALHTNTTYQVMTLPLLDSQQEPLGQVVIMATDTMASILRKATCTVVAILLGIAIVSIVATALILRRVLAPIRELRIGAERIGQGHFTYRLPVSSADEIGALAQAFNAMAANLQQMRAVEEKLRHAERLATIGEFTAATAHELNNPVANIIGLAKVARREIEDHLPLAEDLDLLIKEANRCGAIVRDLLIYSRPLRPNREPVDINSLIDGVLAAMLGRHQDGKEVSFHFDRLPPHEATVSLDAAQIEQVLRNLLLNGIQAIQGKGRIRIQAERIDADQLRIIVADSGCGMKEEHLAKIFYPFFTTKKAGEGTGLGLAVCYAVIQGHGGEITVKSHAGEGSIFTVTLPIGERHD